MQRAGDVAARPRVILFNGTGECNHRKRPGKGAEEASAVIDNGAIRQGYLAWARNVTGADCDRRGAWAARGALKSLAEVYEHGEIAFRLLSSGDWVSVPGRSVAGTSITDTNWDFGCVSYREDDG